MEQATDERRKLINKGRRWLTKYLQSITVEALSEKNRTQLISVVCSLYQKDMKVNPDFYSNVEVFCSIRRSPQEKNAFFREMMRTFMEDDRLKKAYARKYPGEYTIQA